MACHLPLSAVVVSFLFLSLLIGDINSALTGWGHGKQVEAYYIGVLSKPECNYCITCQELLVVVLGLHNFAPTFMDKSLFCAPIMSLT